MTEEELHNQELVAREQLILLSERKRENEQRQSQIDLQSQNKEAGNGDTDALSPGP